MTNLGTIQDEAERRELFRRLHSLTPASQARFGTLDAPRMLCHMQDQIRVALGDTECRQHRSVFRFPPLRWLALRLPVPKGKLKTVREMQQAQPVDWKADMRVLVELTERLAAADMTAPHPVLGRLGLKTWGVLTWKHFDHHLAQFGA